MALVVLEDLVVQRDQPERLVRVVRLVQEVPEVRHMPEVLSVVTLELMPLPIPQTPSQELGAQVVQEVSESLRRLDSLVLLEVLAAQLAFYI